MQNLPGKKTVRVLVPLLQNYYIFEYLYQLIPVLCTRGFDVTVATFDPGVKRRMQTECPDAKVVSAPRALRYLNNRSKHLPVRACLWLSAWIWGAMLPRSYDFAIVPWTNKPIWHAVSRSLPSLTCNNTTNFANLEIEAEEIGVIDETNPTVSHNVGFGARNDDARCFVTFEDEVVDPHSREFGASAERVSARARDCRVRRRP